MNRKKTEGAVQDVLTSSLQHPLGITVRLIMDEVGMLELMKRSSWTPVA